MSIPTIHDIQATLPHAAWTIGLRHAAPRYLTLHYNGPAVAARGTVQGELSQLRVDASYQMRPGALGSATGGDGLQYHFAVLSDGGIYQTRALDATLWHCGHVEGNRWSLAIHLPLGGPQDATPAQWAGLTHLFDWLRQTYAIPVARILGHTEWGTSVCPGPNLMRRLISWRTTAPATPFTRTLTLKTATPIYEGPATTFPIALQGAATLAAGAPVPVDAIVTGPLTANDRRWLHLANGVGFIPLGATTGLGEGL